MINEEFTYQEWFDIFTDNVRKIGYAGRIDMDSFQMDYDNDLSPEDAAKSFVEEMNS